MRIYYFVQKCGTEYTLGIYSEKNKEAMESVLTVMTSAFESPTVLKGSLIVPDFENDGTERKDPRVTMLCEAVLKANRTRTSLDLKQLEQILAENVN